MSYESDEYRKLRLLIEAARANSSQSGIRLQTQGANPSMAITVEAYVLEEFLKPEPR